ncbi:MAG: transcriptional coactivator p15/PC4 family protein [Pseudorhodoplanes sp.]|nr:transcriptional coactivator p15/PC4 family protein [Pseudorhodoplanes sp.]
MSEQKSTAPSTGITFPVIVAEWDRNAREVVRVALDHYNGRHTINARVWYHDDDDVLKPGKTGITLAVKHLPAFADAMGKALAMARDLGLIEGPGNGHGR